MNAETLNFLRYDASERDTFDFVPADPESIELVRQAQQRLRDAELFSEAQKRMDGRK